MRILVIIYEFPPIGGGGGRAAYDVCRQLVLRGHQVTVLTAHMAGLPQEEVIDGIHLVRVKSLRREPFRAGFITMLAYILSGFWAGLRSIRAARPHIIHTHFAVPSGALAWMLSLVTGVPYVLTVHLGDVPGGVPEKTGRWFRWLEPFTHPIWRRARRLFAVSEYTRQLALNHYPVQIDVIPNGADIQALAPASIRLQEPVQLVFAGRFVPQKDPLTIVHILSGLTDLKWRCAMLGDGPLMPQVKFEVDKHGLQERFDFPGWVTPQEVIEWFSKSDILFMPSRSEGLPVTGVQALAKGLALVVSRIGGFTDLVDEDANGFLVEVGDHERYQQILRSLIQDHEYLLSLRRNSLQKASAFDISRIAQQYQDVFEEIVRES